MLDGKLLLCLGLRVHPMMHQAPLWLMAVGMGVYQGLNPPVAWLRAVGRGLETRSTLAILGKSGALAFGHFLSMVVLLVPMGVIIAALPSTVLPMDVLMRIGWVLSLMLICFGAFKLIRPNHPRFIARIPPDQSVRWSFSMGVTHCGSPVMMAPMLINLIMVGSWISVFGVSSVSRVASATLLALVLSAAMSLPLFLIGSTVAVTVFRLFGLRAITRYWINFDLGWAAMFIAMGLMGVVMR